MMSSLGSDKARVPREKALPAATHTSQPQKQIQATAEQIRLAQMIYDKNDADFEDKVNQLMEVTGKNQDECMVALHDCNEDVSRAINFLLESTSDMTSWETVGKKKPLVKEGPSESKENKENREKKGEREVSKGRTAANRKGKAASHELLLFLHMKGSDGCCIIVLSGKAPPNLSQGVPPLLPNQYIMGPGGLLPAYPIYGYEDLHMLQSRLPMDYYGITFPGPTATLSGRDGSLANNPYSGEVTKFGRNDSTSPAPPTSLAAPQPPQGQSQGQNQAQPQPPQAHYTGLPYYPGVPGAVPSAAAFQYGPTMFVPPGAPGPASAKQHSMGLGLGNPSASPFQQQTQQQPSGYGQHTFSSGYEELTAGPAGVDYSKGYNSSSQAQAKSAATGPGKGVSVTSSNSGVPDISGSVYNKTQSFDKQGFHAGTPPPFSLPSALGGPGPLNPGAAPGGYAPAPFLHILPHQQPHSQLLHHHLAQDGQVTLADIIQQFHR
uniref:Ubiquitin associated protein 2a n=1 Tax=Dicentrarchus labrax TaxID=13489 RepID=A0A8P4GMS6_DICLA